MTTAARPTWAPAKGGNEQGGTRIFGPSQKYSSRDMAAHTSLKPRKPGQDTQDELQKKNLREELEESERKHYSSKDKSYSYDRDRRRGNQLLLEGGRRDTEIVPRNIDADDSDVEAQSDDERLANHALLKEIREINRQLINTIVVSNDEDVDPSAAATAEGDEGTIFKCSFEAVALSPSLKSQYASGKMSKIPPLKLIVPTNYPESSPILLDMFPVEVSEEYEDLSVKAQSRLSKSLRSISQPMSLQEIARTWDICAHAVISEQAQQRGGGSLSSRYGTWENCLSAA